MTGAGSGKAGASQPGGERRAARTRKGCIVSRERTVERASEPARAEGPHVLAERGGASGGDPGGRGAGSGVAGRAPRTKIRSGMPRRKLRTLKRGSTET